MVKIKLEFLYKNSQFNYIRLCIVRNIKMKDLKKLFNSLEGLTKKATASYWSLTFNEVCIKIQRLPNYTKKKYKINM